MSGVDVLAVMDQAIQREKDAGQAYLAQVAARAAVAELIDRVEARKRLRDEFREWSKVNPGQPAPREFMQRFHNADELVNAALARVQGGQS